MEALEAAITTRITTAIDNSAIHVQAWPDEPFDLGKPICAASVFVRFAGLQLGAINSPNRGSHIQGGFISFEVRYICTALRGSAGAYALMGTVLKALTGWLPDGASFDDGFSGNLPGVQLQRSELIDRSTTAWDWGQFFQVPITYKQRNR